MNRFGSLWLGDRGGTNIEASASENEEQRSAATSKSKDIDDDRRVRSSPNETLQLATAEKGQQNTARPQKVHKPRLTHLSIETLQQTDPFSSAQP